MAWLKCALVGIATAVVAAVAWVTLRILTAFSFVAASGSGGLGSVSGGVAELAYAGIVGFVLGFYLTWRRQQARVARHPHNR